MGLVLEEVYTNKDWFKSLKSRWATNFDDLAEYWLKMKVRKNSTGMFQQRFEVYPTKYQ